jgi:hypothetical protein
MSTYQDVVQAKLAVAAWSFAEAAGLAFAPYIGGSGLVGAGTFAYQQAGPFAASFGLRINVGAKLTLTFVQTVVLPITFEAWFKLAVPPAAAEFLFYNGNAGANGNGIYVATVNSHLHYFAGGGVVDTDLGVTWPNGNWHLLDVGQDVNGVMTLSIDGVTAYRGFVTAPIAPAPNVLTIGGSSTTTSAVQLHVAMAAYYISALTPQQAASNFLASTDPNSALLIGGTLGADLSTLYALLHRTFPAP